uniref:Uncharacterized protein n=1 Tax=Kryptolebias marmoratus TaxID=37003 RepID=A0A3Q3BFF9_KRYMA
FVLFSKMAAGAAPVTGPADQNAFPSIPKHSYWLDFWVFVMFDIALFLFVYFLIP